MNKELKVKLGVFRNDRRAFYSFIVLATLFVLTLPAEILCNIRPLIIVVDGKPYFPIAATYSEKDFGGSLPSEPDYKSQSFSILLSGTSTSTPDNTDSSGLGLDLGDFEDEEDIPDITSAPLSKSIENSPRSFWMLWPPVRYDYKYIPTESITGNVVLAAPYKTKSPIGEGLIDSSWMDGHYLGTDDRGRDVLARLIYGFRISMLFGVFASNYGNAHRLSDWRHSGVFRRLGRPVRTKTDGDMGFYSTSVYIDHSQFFSCSVSFTTFPDFKSHSMDGDCGIHTRGIFKNTQL